MRIPIICSQCGMRDIYSKKPTILSYYREGDEMLVQLEYPRCGHLITLRRPYAGVDTLDGYVLINTPEGLRPEHRFVWEEANGKLAKGMVVHHINGIKQDNRLENLIALPKNRHNNSMSQPKPIIVSCPHCQQELKLIKVRANEYVVLNQ